MSIADLKILIRIAYKKMCETRTTDPDFEDYRRVYLKLCEQLSSYLKDVEKYHGPIGNHTTQ